MRSDLFRKLLTMPMSFFNRTKFGRLISRMTSDIDSVRIGVQDVAFHKKRGLAVEDRVKSHWVYRQLRNFRAGIEAGISCLKRAFGLARCTWKGLPHFQAYVWSAVVAYNLALFARVRLQV